MKNKNIGGEGCFVNSAKKAPMQKCAKNAENNQTLKNFSSLVSLTWHFTKFIFLEQLTACPSSICKLCSFFFLFSKQSSSYEPFTSFVSFS